MKFFALLLIGIGLAGLVYSQVFSPDATMDVKALNRSKSFRKPPALTSQTERWRAAAPKLPAMSTSTPATLTVSWNASEAASGYRLYWGTSPTKYEYEGVEDVGNVTTAVVSNLDPAKQYYFSVTAYSAEGSESTFAEESSAP